VALAIDPALAAYRAIDRVLKIVNPPGDGLTWSEALAELCNILGRTPVELAGLSLAEARFLLNAGKRPPLVHGESPPAMQARREQFWREDAEPEPEPPPPAQWPSAESLAAKVAPWLAPRLIDGHHPQIDPAAWRTGLTSDVATAICGMLGPAGRSLDAQTRAQALAVEVLALVESRAITPTPVHVESNGHG
jgi:hypothetical protein